MLPAPGTSAKTETMASPLIRRATQLPIVSWSDWDNVTSVKAAIRQHENGAFDLASQIVEAMGRDDRISGCCETRTRALPALPLLLEPRGDGRQKQAVANELDEEFERFYPDAALTELVQWGIFLGVGIAENVWQYSARRWEPKLKVWHPKYLTFRQDTRSYWLYTVEGPREITPGDGQWVLFTPYGDSRGWMHGKVRSLYVPWLMRQWGLRDWARYSEVHGLPIRKAVTPPGAQEADKEAFLAAIAAIGTETTLRTPRVAGGGHPEVDRYDLELIEAMSNSWETFDKLLDKAEACIAIALLGQNLTTEVKGGSYAAAQAHMAIRNDILAFDAESLGQCLRQQSIAWWALHNFGSAELAPMPKWKTKAKTPEERTAKGTAFKNLGEGIATLRSTGVQVDVDKVIEEEDISVTGAWKEPEPPAPQAAPTPANAQPQVRPGGVPALPRPTAQAALLSEDGGDLPLPAVAGQSYVDSLGADGTRRAVAALSQDVEKVLRLVAEAPDYGSLRDRLIEAYGDMDEEALAALLHQGMLMAALAGRYAVRKEAGLPDAASEAEE